MEKKFTIGKLIIYVLVLLCMLITLYPIVYILSMSLSGSAHILKQDIWLLPKDFSFESYKLLFKESAIWVAYYNTIKYTVLGTVVGLSGTVALAYAVSQKTFRYRRIVIWYMMFTMFFSGGMVPLYVLINQLNMINTPWAIVLPGAINAWNMVIARTYLTTLPASLVESARLDGASEFTVLWRIIVPIAKPIIAVLALYLIVGYWNTYFTAVLYLEDIKLQPLQNYLHTLLYTSDFSGTSGASLQVEMLKYSSIVIAMFPIMCIYPFFQKYFVKGIMVGSIKE